jgi:hypothetical protein
MSLYGHHTRGFATGKTCPVPEDRQRLQGSSGTPALRARDLTRTHRERLLANGFLQEVIKGWYIPSRPVPPEEVGYILAPLLSSRLIRR